MDGHRVIDTEQVLMVHRQGHPLSYLFRADEVGNLPAEPEPEAPGFVHVPWDAVDTWRRKAANSFTTHRIRITASTAGPARATCALAGGHHAGGLT